PANSLVNILNPDQENISDDNFYKHSHYYDSENFMNILKNKKKFNIISTNIESINSKYNELNLFLDELHEQNCDLSALCLQECWLKDEYETEHLQLNGYKKIVQGSSVSSKGGLVIYLKDCYDYIILPQSHKSENWEGLFIEVKGGDLKRNYILGNIYRPPRDLIDNYRNFIDELSNTIANIDSYKKNTVIVGDFNINLLKLNEKDIFNEFLDVFIANSYQPDITLPTRFSHNNATLIDHIYSKLNSNSLKEISGILLKKFSDHQPCFIVINEEQLGDSRQTKENFIKVSRITEENLQLLKNELDNASLLDKLDNSPTADPNLNYDKLSHIIANAKNKCIPNRIIKFNKYKHPKSKWATPGILRSIRYRDKLYKSWRLAQSTPEICENIKTNLSTYNCILKRVIRDAKKIYYGNCFSRFKNDLRNTWRTINEILGRRKQVDPLPSEFHINNNRVDDKNEIANHFNKYFLNIGQNLAADINYTGNQNFTTYLNKTINAEFSFSHVTPNQIEKVVNNLNNKHSSGADGISTIILKKILKPILPALTLIVNQTLSTGIFPDKLKVAKIIPLYKKGDKSIISNYRPISLLPSISKVFERIIYNQLYEYFTNNDLFYKNQYGFRKKHSTELAALELIDRIKRDLDKGELPIAIFLDLSKAFDTIDHDILISKLTYYGIKNKALELLVNYLKNRKQYVDFNNTISDKHTIKTGVPQGSILGPLLFLIYINDIAHSSLFFNFITFADDSTIYKSLKMTNLNESIQFMNNELKKISEWLKLNKLSLNVNKSNFIAFHDTKRILPPLHLLIDGSEIHRTNVFCYLGIYINENANWKSHVNNISTKISRINGTLNRLKHYLPSSIKIQIYNSLILPHLYFGILAWGFDMGRIPRLQKTSVRILTNNKYNAHTEPLFKQMKLLKVQDIHKIQQYKFYYKFLANDLPSYFRSSFFIPYDRAQSYNTRLQLDLMLPRIKHEFMRKCIRYSIPILINEAPPEIKDKFQTHSLDGFTRYLKVIYINNYKIDCTIHNCYICRNS
ncbi:MAG: reverse transcriptase family protein, partial [Candidatus Kariarchaeum pelagius]